MQAPSKRNTLALNDLLNLCSCVQSLPLVPCSGDDGDAGIRLAPCTCTFGTYRSPQDQGWLSKGRDGEKRPRASFNTKLPCITIFLDQFAYPEPIVKLGKAFFFLPAFCADARTDDVAHKGIDMEPAGVLQPLSSHLSNIMEPWKPP